MHEQGFLLGNQATYDAFNQAARACYWKQANDGLFSHGVDAWWCDCTEPFEADWQGAIKPEPEEQMRINTEEAKRYLDPELINAYSLLHSARHLRRAARRNPEQTRGEPDPLGVRRSAALRDDHLVGRYCGDLGNAAPPNRRLDSISA